MWDIWLFALSLTLCSIRTCEIFGCSSPLWDDVQYVHVRHLAAHPLFEMIINLSMWEFWLFTTSLRWCSKCTCETFGSAPPLWDDVQCVHVRHLAVYPLFWMMLSMYMWDILLFTLSLIWCSIHTCETIWCLPSLWDDVQYIHASHVAVHPLFEMMFNMYLWDIWPVTLSVRWCSIHTWETFGCLFSLWNDVQYLHVRHLAVHPLFDMMLNTYTWDNLMFTLSLGWCSIHTCEPFGCSPSLWDYVQYIHVRYLAVYPHFEMTFNTYMWDNLMFTLSLRWCSIHTCEPFGCSTSLWDYVQYKHVR